eukprot:scaffold22804_cov74-Phaeocystis_antarctica.AAC.8
MIQRDGSSLRSSGRRVSPADASSSSAYSASHSSGAVVVPNGRLPAPRKTGRDVLHSGPQRSRVSCSRAERA